MIARKFRSRIDVLTVLCTVFLMLMSVTCGSAAAAALTVRVQPSGDTFANAYVITGESRTYFGNVEGGTGPYQYKWEFSNGGDTGFANVSNSRYIAFDNKAFDTAGTHWARLTVKDSSATPEIASATINLQVIAAGSDNLTRKKNSAIDRGLRYLYQQERVSGSGSYWPGSGYWIGSTGMALIALENHGHNLQSPDSDIYKKSVQEGVRYLLNNAYKIDISNQGCIGDPEADDGDSDHDGKGVRFGDDNTYTSNIAVLALVNSCDKATAQATVATTTSGNVNGMTLYDVVVDAKDFIAYAQGDQSSTSTGISFSNLSYSQYFSGSLKGLTVSGVSGYFYDPDLTTLGCGGSYTINWGDGNSDTFGAGSYYCPYGGNYGYPDIGYGSPSRSHTYAAAGSYTISISYQWGQATVEVARATIRATDPTTCSDNGANGGWRYSANSTDSDNSVTQWPVLALSEAKNRWDINVNPKVIARLNDWLAYSQCTDGSFGYTSGDSSYWCNFPKGAAGAIMLKYAGKSIGDAPVQKSLTYLSNNWGNYENLGYMYSMYAYYKAMKSWALAADNGGRDWNQLYTQYLVDHQSSSNTWHDSYGWMDDTFATYSALAILAPEVASLPPVANAGGPYADAVPLQSVSLDGSKSFHQDPTKQIVKWEWDFDASDGLWWNSKQAPAAGEGAVGITAAASYPKTGSDKSYTVTLRVSDNSSPVMTATSTAGINVTTGNVPPVAVTNGPWAALPNTDILFDGTKSYDPNSCTTLEDPKCLADSITKYEWDLNGDGIFNNSDGSDGTPLVPGDYSKVKKSFSAPISLPATLRVTDENQKVGVSSAQYNIVSVSIVYARQYEVCYKTTLDRTHEKQGIRLKFKNLGNAAAENLVMTATQTPSNIPIYNGKSVTRLGSLGPNEEKYSACDPVTKTADIEVIFNRTITPTGDWRWRSAFDMGASHYQVDNIPPLY